MSYCEDCGCRMYGGMCTNCDEETFIAEQYRSLGESVPETISRAEQDQRLLRSATHTAIGNSSDAAEVSR